MKALVLAVLTNMNLTQYQAVCALTGEYMHGSNDFEMAKGPAVGLIHLVRQGYYGIDKFSDVTWNMSQDTLNTLIEVIKPTWTTVSPTYKTAERTMAQKCMIQGFEYDMYVGWVDSFATVHGRPFVRMPREMYNLEMDKLSK